MAIEDSSVRCVMEPGMSLPLTASEALHWDGIGTPSRCWEPTENAVPILPALLHPLSAPAEAMSQMLASSSAAIDWVREATTVTFYLVPVLLRNASHGVCPGVTGALVWVRRGGHPGSLPPTGSPAVVVHVVSAEIPTEYVEVMPHFPAGDPLLHHIGLVLQVAGEAASAASHLYAEVLTNALAVHFLRRYVACTPPVRPVTSGLTPAMLRRTITYIHAHLEDELPLAALAAVVQVSPNHFARRFKQTTGQTPHHYVLACRIARAKQLLAETALPLSAIGPQVGWPDQSYFTALFRKHVAMTPKAYRAATHRA